MTASVIDTLRRLLSSRVLEPFISHIRYPHYKNLSENERIDFNYPITAIVGENGTNKTSVLRSLYGSPENQNLGNFWFSTCIDPIKEDGGNRNCFIYGYWNNDEQKTVEVLKTRIRNEKDPDYWEPSRGLAAYGMEKMPELPKKSSIPAGRSKTRWNPIKKDVVYIDFRASLSAFDKFFYHGELRGVSNSDKNKKGFIRRRSIPLKKAIEDGLKSHIYQRKQRITNKTNIELDLNMLDEISEILGRKYKKISMVRHEYFNCDAYTCQMTTSDLMYTEAFAGSGEFAVTRIVYEVMSAADQSLILLDEPEVSLHPGAQDRLIDFLSRRVIKNKHQVVLATHSPSIVRKLPPEAIKLLTIDKISGKTRLLKQSSLPEEAFFHIGELCNDRITILVEDQLAQLIVLKVIEAHGQAMAEMFDVQFYPGGAETIWSHYIPIFTIENRRKLLILFDGDRRKTPPIRDPETIPMGSSKYIDDELYRVSGTTINFYPDGGKQGADTNQLLEMKKSAIKWIYEHVDYLPGESSPEEFLWDKMEKNSVHDSLTDQCPKTRFSDLARIENGTPDFKSPSSNDILSIQKRYLATIDLSDVGLADLWAKISSFADRYGMSAGSSP